MSKMEEHEVCISMPRSEAKEIFLCLCDAAHRIHYCGTHQIYQRVANMRNYISIEDDPMCKQAWKQFSVVYTSEVEVAE